MDDLVRPAPSPSSISLGGGCANGPARPSSRERRPRSHRSTKVWKRRCSVSNWKRSTGGLDVAAVPLLDQRCDAVARLPRRPRQAAGEEHVVLGLELLEPGGERLRSFWTRLVSVHAQLAVDQPDQKPDERQPQLPRVGNRPVVDQHVGRVEAADDGEEVAQRDGVLRIEARAMAQRGAGAERRDSRRSARAIASARA